MPSTSLALRDVPKLLLAASEQVLGNSNLGHHLAKASVERWFAFELGAVLDELLHDRGWVALVEKGGRKFNGVTLGNFDVLLVPKTATTTGSRVHLRVDPVDPWPQDAIAIELKGAHLADGSAGRDQALLDDLTKKPERAADLGRCATFFGILITTSGLGPKVSDEFRAATAKRELAMTSINLLGGGQLRVVERTHAKPVDHQDWAGKVWVEIVVANTGEGSSDGT